MKNFYDWCSDKKLTLPTSENTHRAGLSQEYPDGYVRNQYPDAYFAPTVATSYLDLQNAKKTKSKKDAGETSVK